MKRMLLLGALLAGCSADAGEPLGEESLEASRPAKLQELARVEPLSRACPGSRNDELCVVLRAGRWARAREIVTWRMKSEPRREVTADPAVRVFLRERATSVFAQRAGNVVHRFPLYDRLEVSGVPARQTPRCDRPREALVVFPGVIRLKSKDEFGEQIAALRKEHPCLEIVRVETGTFVEPRVNAQMGKAAVDRIDAKLGPVPIHLLGYSQGVTNGLYMLSEHPSLAARTRSVVAMSSAAHGSETVDAILAALRLKDTPGATCEDLPEFARPACRDVARRSLAPIATFLEKALEAMGAAFEGLEHETAGEFVGKHLDGFRSLSTAESDRFWQSRGARLPRDAVYLSFRSVITDRRANLPGSNALSYFMLERSRPDAPYNDMQVRLARQPLGVPGEVLGYVAEGNHWQWELSSRDVPENLMPARMLDGVPRTELLLGYYAALADAGVLLPD